LLLGNTLGQAAYTHVPVTKQYYLVLANGRRHFLVGKVTAGLAESNGSPLLDGWLGHLWAGCLYTAISSGPMLGNEYGKTLPFFTFCKRTRIIGRCKNKSSEISLLLFELLMYHLVCVY